jgi:hypothetical protein
MKDKQAAEQRRLHRELEAMKWERDGLKNKLDEVTSDFGKRLEHFRLEGARSNTPLDVCSLAAKNAELQIKAEAPGRPVQALNLRGVDSYDEILDRVLDAVRGTTFDGGDALKMVLSQLHEVRLENDQTKIEIQDSSSPVTFHPNFRTLCLATDPK